MQCHLAECRYADRVTLIPCQYSQDILRKSYDLNNDKHVLTLKSKLKQAKMAF
jgi:hypothetical protein